MASIWTLELTVNNQFNNQSQFYFSKNGLSQSLNKFNTIITYRNLQSLVELEHVNWFNTNIFNSPEWLSLALDIDNALVSNIL